MADCINCKGYVFFKPLSNESFSCCQKYDETVQDIDLGTGVSPMIKKYWLGMEDCNKFKRGDSICLTLPENPFKIHPIRQAGEKFLKQAMTA